MHADTGIPRSTAYDSEHCDQQQAYTEIMQVTAQPNHRVVHLQPVGRRKMFTSVHEPRQNHLLATLQSEEYGRLLPHLELVVLRLGDVLCESGERMAFVYFPTSSIISLHYVTEDGSSAEIAGVGNEGILGISLFMGGDTTPSAAVVQTGGYGYRLKADFMLAEFNRAGAMMRLLLRYTQALITQMSQTAVCNRHHSLEQQLCRWLLLTLDRLPSNELVMTHELVASMLGVRRESVTQAASKLQRAGIISYHRGHISVLDRPGLELHVCECYQVVKEEVDRLLSDVRNTGSDTALNA